MADLHVLFGKNLRRIRQEQDLTQEALADRCNISVPYVSNLERGLKNPSLDLIQRLAKGLGVSPIRLFAIPELTGTDTDEILALLVNVAPGRLKKIKSSVKMMV